MKKSHIAAVVVYGTMLVISAGCATNPDGSAEYKRTGVGALGGALVGAGAGALFGGNRGANAAIGAAAGAALGGGIGNYMDHQAAALKKSVPEAKVERQGEKIYMTLPSGILFDINKDALKPAAMESLARASATLRESQTDIIIQGHTDATGSNALNQALSERRANRVRDFLSAQGIPPSRMVAIGYGSTRPAFPNDSETNRALNRRVQLEISPNAGVKTQTAK